MAVEYRFIAREVLDDPVKCARQNDSSSLQVTRPLALTFSVASAGAARKSLLHDLLQKGFKKGSALIKEESIKRDCFPR